jgi:WhiB family redox-sensing transcriptional regulator
MTKLYREIAVSVPKFVFTGEPNCAEADPELFFPKDGDELYYDRNFKSVYQNEHAAKKICHACPLIRECLEFATRNGEMGIWGGTTESERKSIRRRSLGVRVTVKTA